MRQLFDCLIKISLASDSHCFSGIGQKHVNMAKSLLKIIYQKVGRIIVAIKRDSQAASFHSLQHLWQVGPQVLLKIERRKRKVLRRSKILQIEILHTQVKNCSGI